MNKQRIIMELCPDCNSHVLPSEQYSCYSCKTWVCNRCQNRVPWENGGADDYPTLCDECWYEIKNKLGELHVEKI